MYRSFYQKYLKHLPLTPIENLEIWGLSSESYPYDGCLSVKLEFPGSVTGVNETISALVLVCPDPIMKGEVSILVGTNTSVVKKLVEVCKEKGGENFLKTLAVHPVMKNAYEKVMVMSDQSADTERGTVWFSGNKPLTLSPGETASVTGIPKYPKMSSSSALLIDYPEESRFPEELLVRPEIQAASALQSKRITVTVRNVSVHTVTLKRGMPIAHIFPVEVVSSNPSSKESSSGGQWTTESFNFGDSPVSQKWRNRLTQKMLDRSDVFSRHEFDVGCARSTQHQIRLTEDKPFRERSRRLAPADIEDVRQHLANLKDAGIISESRSPYASPIVVVRKKNGQVRMCVDYRTLNRRTTPDQYTVPRIEDALACLNGSKWFSVLDLRSGYYQVPLCDQDKEKTAFICPVGFYQFERMPQGISGAPATFQRIMERTVGDMNLLEVLVYLDDLIIFGKTLEEHEERLLKVLDRLKDEGLKLSLDKCKFCQTSVSYVGHIVSQDGVSTDPSKIEAVSSWPRPCNVTELRSFLGFCGYYRRFVKDFSLVSFPLNQLLQGCLTGKMVGKTAKMKPVEKVYYKPSELFGDRWDERCEAAFEELKARLTKAPVLAFADSRLPYTLHVDASCEGLGGVLYQDQGQGLRPVAFVSRSLTPCEKNYPVHKLEFLALKWAVVDKLHDYLYGVKFEVQTDNNPLTYILTTAKLDATGHRWLAALSIYEFSLKYRPGKQNIDADALSRRPHQDSVVEEDWMSIPSSGVRAMCQLSEVDKENYSSSHRAVGCLGGSVKSVPVAYCNLATLSTTSIPRLGFSDLSAAQREDLCFSGLWNGVQHQDVGKVQRTHKDMPLLLREWDRVKMENGVMYRHTHAPNKPKRKQLLLPQKFHQMALRSLHDDSGHLGFEKTYAFVRDRFYWPRMKSDVEQYCRTCARCVQRKTLPKRVAPLSHLSSGGPLDLVCMDFLSIEPDSSNTCNVLVITDHYTRYAQAFSTKDQKATTVAKVLWEKYFVHYGLPRRMHSDQGRDFESKLVHELLEMLGVEKSRTTPYHPQGDPQPERFNRTLLDMLGTLDTKQKNQWSRHIGHLVHVYNCSQNDATGYAPYYLMFGREARLPIDLSFGISCDGSSIQSYQRYVTNMRKELKAAYELAEAAAKKKNDGNKKRYDQRIHYSHLSPGDRVLIRNLGLQGKHKLADRWSSVLYIVESQMPNLPVFRLKPEEGNGPVKILHRNHLLPVGHKLRFQSDSEIVKETPKRILRKRKGKQTRGGSQKLHSGPDRQDEVEGQVLCESSDSEDEECGPWIGVPSQDGCGEDTEDVTQPPCPDSCVVDTDQTVAASIAEEPCEQDIEDMSECSELSSDYGVEDLFEESHSVPQHSANLQEPESVPQDSEDRQEASHGTDSHDEVGRDCRKSQRIKTVPKRFTYDELGEPHFSSDSPVRHFSTLSMRILGKPSHRQTCTA